MITPRNISVSYTEFEKNEELSFTDRELVDAAKSIALKAYAPYSKFRVGAAVRLTSGRIVCGANVENSAYPSGICAERNALANSVVNYPKDIPVAVAVAALNEEGLTEEPVPPCGNCRQFMAEEEFRNGKEIRIILSGNSRTYIMESVSSLLPVQFNNKNLKVNLP